MKRILLTAALGLFAVASFAQWSNPSDDVPAYHPAAPASATAQPPILSGAQLTGDNFRYAWQVEVYKQAAKISPVLYQLPCYCRCDRALGHSSLRSCFEGTHGAECSTCAKEEAYAYKMTKSGWTPKQIREGIERNEYQQVDLTKLGSS